MRDSRLAFSLLLRQWVHLGFVVIQGWDDKFLPFEEVAPEILSVSSQFRRENYHQLWTQCPFVLAPGPLQHTEQFLSRFQPEVRRLIRCMIMDVSWADLTPEVLSIIERDAAVLKKSKRDGDAWAACVQVYLARIWREKLAWIRDNSNAEEVRILSIRLSSEPGSVLTNDPARLCRKMIIFRNTRLNEVMNGIDGTNPQVDCYGAADQSLAECMRYAEDQVFRRISQRVRTVSWKYAKSWIRQFALKGYINFAQQLHEVDGLTAT
ncbi:MAG: hypothetical protein Q9167_007357 [Letrouitia subvulpina]